MLPAHERIVVEIAYVMVRRLRIEFKKKPADVGVEKTFLDVVRIFLVVGVFVMPPMFARPHEDRVFESAGTEEKHKQAQGPLRFVGFMREQPVITSGDAESGERDESKEHSALEPVEVEEPKVNRQTDDGEERCSDEERTGEPVNPVQRERKYFQKPVF